MAWLGILLLLCGTVKVKHKVNYNHRDKVVKEEREVINRVTGKKEILRTIRVMEYV